MLQACCVQQNQMGNHRNWSFSGLDHILRKHLCYWLSKKTANACSSFTRASPEGGRTLCLVAGHCCCLAVLSLYRQPSHLTLHLFSWSTRWVSLLRNSIYYLHPLERQQRKLWLKSASEEFLLSFLYDSVPHSSDLVERLHSLLCNCKSNCCSLTFCLQEQMHWNRTFYTFQSYLYGKQLLEC